MKILNKILTNPIQEHIKNNKENLILEYKNGSVLNIIKCYALH